MTWLSAINSEGNLPEPCRAIYIGLFEGETEYQMHFVGSIEFDSEDEDWACEEERDYLPENRYLLSGVSKSTDWSVFEGDVIQIIKELKAQSFPPLNAVENIGIGFDSGGLTIL